MREKARRLFSQTYPTLRRHRDHTQDQLAEKAWLSLKHLGKIERGRGNPTLTSPESLAATLRVSIIQLFGHESERLSPGQIGKETDLIVHNASEEERMGIMRS